MSILFRCFCGRQLTAPESGLVKRIKCPGCGVMATVPVDDDDEVQSADDDVPQQIRLDPITGEEIGRPKAVRKGGPERVRCDFPVDYRLFVQCFPVQPVVYGVLTFGFLMMAILEGFLLMWVIAILIGSLNVLVWFRAKALGSMGFVCPAQVIGDSPYRLAVYADLSREDGYWPVLKVVDQPLAKMHGGPPKVGDLLPVAAAFQPDPNTEEHFADLEITAIPCLTRDEAAMKRLMDQILKPQWVLLKSALAKKKKFTPKMYKLHSPGSGWKDEAGKDDEGG